ncbi:hypothetical protein SAMN05192549_10498 [Duganella sacchari]|uniref:Uncharacterized protein n=1 Tax=Duganella sacchari TaxID=551987 RepID=A0A1M7NPV6_9BURK|nr:hypothetical protein [Duganella sacchari]SHN05892.1 hypothetical protein SAMN05192549_10498 [Duganella sacchari]
MKVCVSLLSTLSLLACGAVAAQDDRYRDERGEDIQLVCYGGAEKPTAEVRSGFEWDAQQHKYVPKQSVETGKSNFQATINVSIRGDRAEIQLPNSLIPPLHGDSDNGWWRLTDLIVGHDEIRGEFRLNALNQPRLSINRRSGAITIDGMIKFSGRCDPDDGHRRF